MTKKEVVVLVSMLSAAYPRADIPKETIVLYQQFLQDMEFGIAKAAVAKHIALSQYFPTIAELRESAYSLMSTAPLAGDAWAEVTKQLSRVGLYSTGPEFSHPAIQKAVAAIGWRNLCMSEEIGVERAHFLRIYDAYRKQEAEEIKLTTVLEQLGLKGTEILPLACGNED